MRNERWSTPSEIKRVLTEDTDCSCGGPVLYCENGHHWKYTTEGHAIFLGISGSGKTRRGTIPAVRSFIDAKESFTVIDPKGEIYVETAGYLNKEYRRHVIDFRHIYDSECVNILAAPTELYRSGDPIKKQVALEMIDDLSHTLYTVNGNADPFWPESARSLFVATVYSLMEYAAPEEINMTSVYQFILKGEKRCGGPFSSYLKEFLDTIPQDSLAAMLLQNYANNASDTAAGIRSTCLEGISMFARSDGLISMMGSDDLHINQLDGVTPTAIYIILPDESPIYDRIAAILISQIMGHYIRLAQDRYDGRLPRRVNFLVEEAGNIGRISTLGHLLSAGRSRNVRCQLVIQSYSQLQSLYGEDEASTIRSNADVLIAFRNNNWETLSELSNMCGEREIENCGRIAHENLIAPSDLAAFETGQALIMISGATKFVSWLPDYTDIFDCTVRIIARIAGNANRSMPKVFDICEYVRRSRNAVSDFVTHPVLEERTWIGDNKSVHDSRARPADVPDFDISSLVKRIDERIAELEEQEKAEEDLENSREVSFALLGYNGKKKEIIKAILANTDTPSIIAAMDILSNLPYTFYFETELEADMAKNAMLKAGGVIDDEKKGDATDSYGIVIVDTNGNEDKIAEIIQRISGMSWNEASECARTGPYFLQFQSYMDAKEAADSLINANAEIITLNFET